MKKLTVTEFMKLPDAVKEEYTQVTHPSNDPTETLEYDFGVFKDSFCEVCRVGKNRHAKVCGTSDPREPKFCLQHFTAMSKSDKTEFVLTAELDDHLREAVRHA